jgi:predicted DNA-binding transcriptional regulator AlpA
LQDPLAAVLAEIRQLRAEVKELKASASKLLPVKPAAAYLGLEPKTIYNGLGPRADKPFPVKPVRIGGKVLFKKADLDRFIDSL